MKLLQNSSRTVLLALAAVVLAPSTRMTATSFRAPASEECIISAIAYLQIPGAPPMENGDIDFGCDTGNGYFSPLHLTKGQVKSLKELAGNGDIHFGLSKINIHGASFHDDGSITMSPSQIISIVEEGDEPNPFDRRNKRDLQTGTGNKHFLLFRVTDVNGLVISDSPAVMSDKLYGTYGDRNNLKSQMAACSVGKYTVVPGGKEGFDTSGIESAPGVIDIRLDISLDNLRSTVINAALAKAQEVLRNHFKMPVDTPLTTFVDHTLFSLKDCFQECGWAACASVGSFYQFYVSGFYSFSGIQLHEHGHNMQLAHSGGLDGETYTDHTCLMGNPLYGDDLGGMCFNPAKNWQMQFNPHPITVINGWYDPLDFIQIDTLKGAKTIQMIGIGEYGLQGDGVNAPRKAIALQIQNGLDTPQYVAFNSAKGANFQDVEASDQVTIVEYTGTGYGISSLKGYITQGMSFTTAQGRIITAMCINSNVTPSLACVCVRESGQTCPTGCTCTPPPTTSPTVASKVAKLRYRRNN